jgi:hypothetical protein
VLEIKPAKEIKGSVRLPPSGDLFFVSVVIALAAKTRATISPVSDLALVSWWKKILEGHASFSCNADNCVVQPENETNDAAITLSCDEIPYRDFSVFALLGLGKTIVIDGLTRARIEAWTKVVSDHGCGLIVSEVNGKISLHIDRGDNFRVRDTVKSAGYLHSVLGLALGLGKDLTLVTDSVFTSPLRNVLPAFGYTVSVSSNLRDKGEDPLVRRMRFLQIGKKSEGPVLYTVSADFAKRTSVEPDITLPGDDALGAIITVAKCIVPKGSLILENVGLETWSTAALSLFKKMGGVVATQETGQTSYGLCGTVTLTKFGHSGRKVECEPLYMYVSQLPAMVVLAAYASGQSVFRGLADLRNDEPDALAQIIVCLGLLGARHGEMPDGIVVDGGHQFDGFDIRDSLPAHIAASFAVAGLRCMGATTINDDAIQRKWPGFGNMLLSICEFRE